VLDYTQGRHPGRMAELWTFDTHDTHLLSKGTAHNGSFVELCGGDHGFDDLIPEEIQSYVLANRLATHVHYHLVLLLPRSLTNNHHIG
jgi:hypothetical protein